jgi:hypothetical protein
MKLQLKILGEGCGHDPAEIKVFNAPLGWFHPLAEVVHL